MLTKTRSIIQARRRRAQVLAGLLLGAAASAASADFIPVYGGPTYTPGVGGYPQGSALGVTNSGVAIGSAMRLDALGAGLGRRPVLFDAAGMPPMELAILGTSVSGQTYGCPYAINENGAIVGTVYKYDPLGNELGSRPVRWDASGTATELEILGTSRFGWSDGYASAISAAGTSVGIVYKYDAAGQSLESRPVRWDAAGTAATELGILGTDSSGRTAGTVSAINSAGVSVGYLMKHDAAGTSLGTRPVRWDAQATAATELGILGTDASGRTDGYVNAINDAGTIVGRLFVYDASGQTLGHRPVRWDATGVPTQLGILGTDSTGAVDFNVADINSAGTSVGSAEQFDALGTNLGMRPVRWDASGTAATELATLSGSGEAWAINGAGICVGSVSLYDGAGTYLENRAALWDAGGALRDLNTLIDPASGWVLSWTYDISDTGWIAGLGNFDPDGPGGQDAYQRAFIMQVPEPASLGLLLLSAMTLRTRRERVFDRAA